MEAYIQAILAVPTPHFSNLPEAKCQKYSRKTQNSL